MALRLELPNLSPTDVQNLPSLPVGYAMMPVVGAAKRRQADGVHHTDLTRFHASWCRRF